MSCAICLEEFADGAANTVHLPCAHTFHTECFFEYVRVQKFACPMCRRVYSQATHYEQSSLYTHYLYDMMNMRGREIDRLKSSFDKLERAYTNLQRDLLDERIWSLIVFLGNFVTFIIVGLTLIYTRDKSLIGTYLFGVLSCSAILTMFATSDIHTLINKHNL